MSPPILRVALALQVERQAVLLDSGSVEVLRQRLALLRGEWEDFRRERSKMVDAMMVVGWRCCDWYASRRLTCFVPATRRTASTATPAAAAMATATVAAIPAVTWTRTPSGWRLCTSRCRG